MALDRYTQLGWAGCLKHVGTEGCAAPGIELGKPQRADTIRLTPLQLRDVGAERRNVRVGRVEAQIDQGRGGAYEVSMPVEHRRAVLRLPKPGTVRRLDVRILEARGVDATKGATGLA